MAQCSSPSPRSLFGARSRRFPFTCPYQQPVLFALTRQLPSNSRPPFVKVHPPSARPCGPIPIHDSLPLPAFQLHPNAPARLTRLSGTTRQNVSPVYLRNLTSGGLGSSIMPDNFRFYSASRLREIFYAQFGASNQRYPYIRCYPQQLFQPCNFQGSSSR
jgi:hypothetical protein